MDCTAFLAKFLTNNQEVKYRYVGHRIILTIPFFLPMSFYMKKYAFIIYTYFTNVIPFTQLYQLIGEMLLQW